MKKRKHCSLLRFSILMLLVLHVQVNLAQELPDIIPPSPRAESFNIYGTIPVSHNTGVPDISIPLYTIESDGITIPIVLKYHINSIKPGRDGSNVAFGWVLDVGGRISRTVNSWPDEYVKRPADFKLSNDLDPTDEDDFVHMYHSTKQNGPIHDTKYDLFSFSVMGDYSQFIIDNQEGSSVSVHELVESPKEISFTTALNTDFHSTIPSIDKFVCTNGMGQTFYFGENDSYEVVGSDMDWGDSMSSWLLTEIVSADKSNSVGFTYEDVPEEIANTSSSFDYSGTSKDYPRAVHFTLGDVECDRTPNCGLNFDIVDYGMYYNIKTLKEVNFNGGRVVFTLSSDKKRISGLEVRNSNDELIKSVNFVTSYFYDSSYPNQTAYLKLESLEVLDVNNSGKKTYTFDYYDNGMPLENKTDFWGYYNNGNNFDYSREITNMSDGIGSAYFFYTCESGHGNKDASLSHAKSYVLNKITYPTGGTTEFNYELHQFVGVTGLSPTVYETINGGGLRIQSIVSKVDENTSGLVKTYQYTPRNYGVSSPVSPMNPYNYTTTNYSIMDCAHTTNSLRKRHRTFSHGFNGGLLDTQVNYEHIVEYQGVVSFYSNIGKTEYTYEYEIENDYFNKSVVDFSYGFDFGSDVTNLLGLGSNKLVNYYGASGGKAKQIKYFKNDNGNYIEIKTVTNDYNYREVINSYKSLNVVPICSYGNTTHYDDFLDRRDTHGSPVGDPDLLPVLGSYDSSYCQSSANLEKEEVIEIQEDGTEFITTTEYTYNDEGLVTEQVTYTSHSGETKKTKKIYPKDLSNATTLTDGTALAGGSLSTVAYDAIEDMIEENVNIVASPIQVETYSDNGSTETLLSLERTNYKNWGGDVLLPEFVSTLKESNTLEDRLHFKSYYADGNLKEVLKIDGVSTVYVWGYSGEYPIAKIENATFETGKANSINTSQQTLIDNAISATLIEYTELSEDNLRAKLQLLRDGFPNAMVSTYTYDPLIGMTSATDLRGQTEYYEYDEFNRLKQVKDAEGNVLSANKYNYKE